MRQGRGGGGRPAPRRDGRFVKELKGSATVTVQVSDKGFSFSAYAAPIKCTKYAPMLGPEQQLAIGLSDKRHPKVGKTYKLKQVENRTEVEEGEQPEHGLFEATVNFKSAKLVVVEVHLRRRSRQRGVLRRQRHLEPEARTLRSGGDGRR